MINIVNFKKLCQDYHLANIFTSYLVWYEIMPLFLIDTEINKLIHHPFIRLAKKHYKIRDGLSLTLDEANKMLTTIKTNSGTELVETAILANIHILECLPTIEFRDINHLLNKHYRENISLPNNFQRVDLEISKAIKWSRCTLYRQFLKDELNNTLSLKDIIFTYEHEYVSKAQNGLLLSKDIQINQIAIKTNMPINYQYIFLNRFLTERLHHQMELLNFTSN